MKSSIRFSRRSEKHSDGTIAIRMRVTWNSNRFDMVLPQRVPEKYWDDKKECCKSSWSDARKYNGYLNFLKNKLDTFFMDCDMKEFVPNKDEVKKLFEIQEYSDEKLIDKLFEDFIEYGVRTRNWSKSTVSNINILRNKLLDFKPDMRADFLTKENILKFIEYCVVKYNLRSSSAHKLFENLRWFMKWAIDNDLGVPRDSLGMKPKFNRIENEPMYLTIEELNLLENVVPDRKTHEEVRDIFVFCCYSGLRYSDVQKLKKSDIFDDKINFVTKKTKDRLSVELNNHTRKILEKYKDIPGDKAFPTRNLGTNDELLKKLAKKAGIDAIVSKTYYIGSKRVEEKYHKYEVISSHFARRTFVIIALTLGIPAEVIMKWTGHKNFDNMKPYVAIVDKLKKQNMQKFDTI